MLIKKFFMGMMYSLLGAMFLCSLIIVPFAVFIGPAFLVTYFGLPNILAPIGTILILMCIGGIVHVTSPDYSRGSKAS